MGNWRITIEGMGIHHNGTKAIMKDGTEIVGGVSPDQIADVVRWEPTQPHDANYMFYEWIKLLRGVGHNIYQAKFEVLGQVEYDTQK